MDSTQIPVAQAWLKLTTFAPIAAVFVLINPAMAQDAKQDDTYIASLRSCQAMTDDTARLNCYDAAVGKVVAANDEGEVRIVDEAEITKTKRGFFGLNLPTLGIFGSDDEEPDLFQSTITNVSVSGGSAFITIADGDAVWQIKNPKSYIKRAESGDPIEFKKASLGSYFVRINGRTGVKGSRVR